MNIFVYSGPRALRRPGLFYFILSYNQQLYRKSVRGGDFFYPVFAFVAKRA